MEALWKPKIMVRTADLSHVLHCHFPEASSRLDTITLTPLRFQNRRAVMFPGSVLAEQGTQFLLQAFPQAHRCFTAQKFIFLLQGTARCRELGRQTPEVTQDAGNKRGCFL